VQIFFCNLIAAEKKEELAKYLEEEEEEDYQSLREIYEPKMLAVYSKVAESNPLQLIALEKHLLKDEFEGLLLPKLLGYTVLRGEVNNEKMKYTLPQDHFKDVLMAICNSSNFDYLKKRIGQAIQIGFSLSSDIWITNLINPIPNKRIRYFLQSQKLDKYRIPKERQIGMVRFARQFRNEEFHSAVFPSNVSELKVLTSSLEKFIVHRIEGKNDHTSILPPLKEFIDNNDFKGSQEHLRILTVVANFIDLDGEYKDTVKNVLNNQRANTEGFVEKYLDFLMELLYSKIDVDGKADGRVSSLLDKTIKDDLTAYYNLMDEIHSKGYIHQDVVDSVKVFYSQNEGVSTINECVRRVIFSYYARLINNLEESEYNELFELAKIFPSYMEIFSNQQFNQDVKYLCMGYIKKLLKKFTDKRGKDYQEIKKFVASTFLELGFLKKKQIVELFKTRRKKKPVS